MELAAALRTDVEDEGAAEVWAEGQDGAGEGDADTDGEAEVPALVTATRFEEFGEVELKVADIAPIEQAQEQQTPADQAGETSQPSGSAGGTTATKILLRSRRMRICSRRRCSTRLRHSCRQSRRRSRQVSRPSMRISRRSPR